MPEYKDDILQEIPLDDLPELAKIYEKYESKYPHIVSTIKTGYRWKKMDPNCKVAFLSPNNNWRSDGTFLALFQFPNLCDVTLGTLDPYCKSLYEGIRYTKRKEFDRKINFYATVDSFVDAVIKALEKRKLKLVQELPSVMVTIDKEQAKKINVDIPPELYIKPVGVYDIPLINSVWPKKYDGSELKLAQYIELNGGGCGAYLKETDQLVAWIMIDHMGQLTTLQTHNDFKKKGYASIVTQLLTKQLAEEGTIPFAAIYYRNNASLKMFEKVGFKDNGRLTYFMMAPANQSKL